jgi:hypothetical protein
MKLTGYVLSVLLVLTGVVWILQGINILPGSFMTGHIEWAIAGAVSLIFGIGLGAYTRRRPD